MYLSNTTICTCVYIHIHSLWCPSWEFSMEKLHFIFSSWDYMNTLFLHKLSPMNFSEHIVNLLHVNIIMTTNGSLKVLLFHLCILISILQVKRGYFSVWLSYCAPNYYLLILLSQFVDCCLLRPFLMPLYFTSFCFLFPHLIL